MRIVECHLSAPVSPVPAAFFVGDDADDDDKRAAAAAAAKRNGSRMPMPPLPPFLPMSLRVRNPP